MTERRLAWTEVFKKEESDLMSQSDVINSKFMFLFSGDPKTVGKTNLNKYFEDEGNWKSFLPAFICCRIDIGNKTEIVPILQKVCKTFADGSESSKKIAEQALSILTQISVAMSNYREPAAVEDEGSDTSSDHNSQHPSLDSPIAKDPQGAHQVNIEKIQEAMNSSLSLKEGGREKEETGIKKNGKENKKNKGGKKEKKKRKDKKKRNKKKKKNGKTWKD